MKLVRLRFKKGVRRKIRETQKLYDYLSVIDVEVGQYVICEVRKTHAASGHDFRVARVEEIVDLKEDDELLKERPFGFVLCGVASEDFDADCKIIQNTQFKLYAKYNGTYKK